MRTKVEEKRTENMNLLRWLHDGNNQLMKILRGNPVWCYVSSVALGKRQLSGYEARSLERTLAYPEGWFDRDNLWLLRLSKEDFETVSLVLNASAEEKTAISTLLARYRSAGSSVFGGAPQLRVIQGVGRQ